LNPLKKPVSEFKADTGFFILTFSSRNSLIIVF